MLLELLKLRRTYKNINRLRQILNVFLKHGFGHFIKQLNLNRFIPFRKRLKILEEEEFIETSIPERLRMVFTELGPSFIKLGQLLSSRPDLITKKYADEFKKLQDEVPPFPFDGVKKIIEEDIGLPLSKIFKNIEKVPLAAASIAQVHDAILIDGRKAVVKVQRPDIKKVIETDVSIMRILSGLMVKYIPEAEFFNPVGIVEEFFKNIKKEMNFLEETKNIERFKRHFKDVPTIKLPDVYMDLISDRVLIMERIEGVRIDDIKSIEKMGLEREELAKLIVDAYFKMIFEDGFFHADPHPGNLFAMPDGRLGIVDHGMVGWLGPEVMESIASSFIALVNKDFHSLINQYIALGLVSEEVDIDRFKQEFLADIIDFMLPLYDLTLTEINFAEYLESLTQLAIKHKLKIPSSLLLVNKCMLYIENLGRQLDPDINVIDYVTPYAPRLIRKRYEPKQILEKLGRNITDLGDFVVTTPKQMRTLLRRMIKDEFHIKITPIGMERLRRDIDKSTNRLSFSIVIASIIMSSSVLTLTDVGGKVFDMPAIGITGFITAFLLGVWLLISILRSGRL